jgi:hydroxymethylpyrimidine/phosphomethylpyrimidine kinase
LKKQIDACIEDIGVDVVKTGAYSCLHMRPSYLKPSRHACIC